MPLLDHFRPPLQSSRHWEGFHSTWAVHLAEHLNRKLLPSSHFAEPQVKWGVQVEIDVATFSQDGGVEEGGAYGSDAGGGTATAVWAPPAPPLTATLDFAGLDDLEVRVYAEEGGPRLVGAIELVSPANKDRPAHRHAFAVKCAAYLQRQVGVVVVDVVTERSANLHAELLQLLGVPSGPPADLYAVAYRALAVSGATRFEAWPAPLAVGAALPTLPLWLASDLVLPLDLETTYAAACAGLRIGA